jgi:tetratricopeptide (TPR) repeat protein
MSYGNCLLELQRTPAAVAVFKRVIALEPESPFAMHNLAVCCFREGDYRQGLAHCLRAIELRPDYVLAIHKAALAMLHLGQWRGARKMLDRAVALDPGDTTIRDICNRLWKNRLRCTIGTLIRPWRWWSRQRTD